MTLIDTPPPGQADPEVTTRRRSSMPQIVAGGVLVFIGLLWLLERIGAIDVSVTAVLGLATMVVGISLMLLAKDGPHAGLIVFGTMLALVTLVTAAAPFEGFQGGVGDRTYLVESVDDISPNYNLAMGKLTIDLRDIEDLDEATLVTASVGMGELLVRVPAGIAIEVEANVGAGQVEILSEVIDGVDIDETFVSPGFATSPQSLSLELQAFTGRVEVTDD